MAVPKPKPVWAEDAAVLPGARKSKLRNEAFSPQLARLGSSPPVGDQWIHELKWDGYRLLATVVGGRCRLWSRNAIEWTDKVPHVAKAIEALNLEAAALDGELIAGHGTQADFNLLQATLSSERRAALTLALFDLIHIDGVDIARAPLIDRKALLARILKGKHKGLAYSSHGIGDGIGAFDAATEQGFEGIISKRADGAYHAGRGDDWRKTKHLPSEEFAVVGYTPGKGSRKGIGSLLLATPDSDQGWQYVGRVGTGFTDEALRQLTRRIGQAGQRAPTAQFSTAKAADLRDTLWFPPMFVVEVFQRGWSDIGVLRQPSLKAIRLDKDIADLSPAGPKSRKRSSAKGR